MTSVLEEFGFLEKILVDPGNDLFSEGASLHVGDYRNEVTVASCRQKEVLYVYSCPGFHFDNGEIEFFFYLSARIAEILLVWIIRAPCAGAGKVIETSGAVDNSSSATVAHFGAAVHSYFVARPAVHVMRFSGDKVLVTMLAPLYRRKEITTDKIHHPIRSEAAAFTAFKSFLAISSMDSMAPPIRPFARDPKVGCP